MRVIAFNGSPRKHWNTATLLEKALDGAKSQGAKTKLIHLYDLNYKGCISCFACKAKGGKSYGKCSVTDDLKSIFDKIELADTLIFGSPIYLGNVTGEMRSFLERLVFQYLTYTDPPGSLFNRQIKTGFIYTMGVTEEVMNQIGYSQFMDLISMFLTRTFGHSEALCSFDTLQFKDYSKYVAPRFDPEGKSKRRKEVFPHDCQKAFEMGQRLSRG
ncbi:MAG: flavodoxin family protein [Dissulfurispiraceae bacterium]|jgi:multimeric flavodoxin WrbA